MSLAKSSQETADPVEPFLKWPGGKRLLLPALVRLAPVAFRRYYEPFLGSGALFFALRPRDAVLSDSNVELIECYEQVRDNCEAVIARLRRLRNSDVDYYRVRGSSPRTPVSRAARLIYLVKLAFNGIYRVNLATGKFNVPYGWRSDREVCDPTGLRAASWSLAASRTLACDFEAAVKPAGPGDFVYFDPPYTLAHTNNGFVRYNRRLFSWPDQVRLAQCAARLASKGARVMVSNAPHPAILRLYPGFAAIKLERNSQIAAQSTYRRTVTELVLTANL